MKSYGIEQSKMLTNNIMKKLLVVALLIFPALAIAVPTPAPIPDGTSVISFQYDAMGNRISQTNSNPDIDGDGILDEWELEYFGDLNHDMTLDSDSDGLTDLEEYQGNTDPKLADTDGDGVSDGFELNNGMNPLDGSDVLLDTDSDGLPDAFEIFHGLNINDPSDISTDNDGDGYSILEEFIAATSDNNVNEYPSLLLDFETAPVMPLYWENSSNPPWEVTPFNETNSLRAGDVNNGESKLVLTFTASGRPLQFELISGTAQEGDEIQFYIDDVLQKSSSGEYKVEQLTYLLTAGKHKLTWLYKQTNDGAYIARAVLDNIVLPIVKDSDTDGIDDTWEYLYFDDLNHDMSLDSDGDGSTDLEEYNTGGNPLEISDSDGDGILDEWELEHFGDLNHDMSLDSDNDGLTDLDEYHASTSPISTDTDEDGINDGFELNNGMNPLDAMDTLLDTDNDGLPDAFEIFHGLDINDNSDVTTDNDNDGYSVLQEFRGRTSDNNANEYPAFLIDFESAPVMPFYWDNSSETPWEVVPFNETNALRAGDVINGESTLAFTFTASGQPLQFELISETLEEDEVQFYIDDVLQNNSSGNYKVEQLIYTLTAGKHELKWIYKQANNTPYIARAVLDNILLPIVKDSDNDGIDDTWEYLYFDALNHDVTLDSDSDGIPDGDEYVAGTNPLAQFDSDSDGILDSWELMHFGNLTHDMSLDTDNDGLTDEDEFYAKTDPKLTDTDEDGISDGYELNNGMNPIDGADALVDTDNDGLPDAFEIFHGLNINDPSDVTTDNDGDGFTIWQEFKAGTSDNNDLDKPQGVIVGFEQQDELPLPDFGQKVNQWFVDDSFAHFGSKSLSSGFLDEDGKKSFEFTVATNGAPISFSYYLGSRYGKIISEDYSDISFYVDGVRIISGDTINQWISVEHQLTAGLHTLKWEFEFDFDEASGSADAVWLDNIFIPIEEDSDNDGVRDLWEISYFTHLNGDLNADNDNDGLTSISEYIFASNPFLKDSDGDKLTDLQEFNIGSNPQLNDSDGDSKSDYFEFNNGLDPTNTLDVLDDLDGDGLPDSFELFHQLDVNDSQDALVDEDQDSYNKLAEFTAETSDTNAIEQPPLLFDFEDGVISDENWTHSGNVSWQVSSVDPISGAYSLKSGDITDDQTSTIETTINSPGDIIAFDVTVSSEEGYDYFKFYIDNELQIEWSGEVSEQHIKLQLAKGVHTLQWVYAKDGSVDEGKDVVIIDNLFLPTLRDIDDDGILDSWEREYFAGLDHDMSLDSDSDGLTDQEEYLEGSNPTIKDTDGDNMADGWEKTQGLNLLVNDAADDIDGNGQINLVEYIRDTPDYPVDIDSDGDGVPDVIEVQMGSNPTDPTSTENEVNIITGTSLVDQLVGSNEVDQIWGLEGNDVIIGGLGNDELDGGLGKDTFQFSLGDGHDVIKDLGGIDIIVFNTSITAEMLSFTQRVEANLFTLIISINNSTDQIDIQNWKKNSFDKSVQIVFADGTTWNNLDIENKILDVLPSEKKISVPKYISGQLNRGRYRFPIGIHYTGNTSSDFAGLVAPSTVSGNVQADDDGQFTIEDIGLGIHHFEIPSGSKIVRFSLRDESIISQGSDLDLYVYQCKKGDCNKLVGKSLNINSNEDVILVNPEVANNQSEGDYYAVYVYGHSTGADDRTDYSMSVWVADKVETTTRVISSQRAIKGRSNYVSILTRGLELGITYMGAVTFYNDLAEAEGTTVLEFDH